MVRRRDVSYSLMCIFTSLHVWEIYTSLEKKSPYTSIYFPYMK